MTMRSAGPARWVTGLLLAACVALCGTASAATTGANSAFQPLETFAPFDFQYPVNRYRSANGLPGPDYWQNRVDYHINARLLPDEQRLEATVVIDYHNNSPDDLHLLWLQLDQNRYRNNARANFTRDKMPPEQAHTSGYAIGKVQLAVGGDWQDVAWHVSDTRMRVDLPEALAAGGALQLRIAYDYPIPDGRFGGRTRSYDSRHGRVYEIAQWFPRMAVYDDLRGWNTLPFLNNEFYLEYGSIDYRVTVPAGMLVAGSGKLVNPDEVLSSLQRQRLEKARHSDKTVMIRTAAEVKANAAMEPASGTKTWHFRMQKTRDVAFAASRAFLWDAARIDLPDGGHALAMSVYPVESIEGDSQWQRSTQYIKHTVEFYSQHWYPYPWATAVAVAGKVGGMEYPGLAFDWWQLKDKSLFGLTTHEIGHSWFPMIVGFNERRAAWMDEGFNTFANVLATRDYANGKFAPKRDGEFAPGGGNPADEIVPLLADPDAPPILTRPDQIPEKYRHPVTYFKTALGMLLLRDVILGPERFDTAFRQFVAAWAFKHPSPSDFFRALDSAAGEDLSWFWRGWFAENWSFDMAIVEAKMVDDENGKGVAVTVANRDKLVLPAMLVVHWADGHTSRTRIPVAAWLQHRQFVVRVPGEGRALSLELDPEHKLPDRDRGNNRVALSGGD